MDKTFIIKQATKEDSGDIIRMLREFANFEGKEDKLFITEDKLNQRLYEQRVADALVAEVSGHKIGYAIYYQRFSSFSGNVNLYIEDLYISPLFRHKGYGAKILSVLKDIANKEMDGVLEWKNLKWNKKAKAFYTRIGAKCYDENETFIL